MTISDQYRALRETAVIGAVSPRKTIGISGKDRAVYLQGLLTNDIQALASGTGCYAAWLTPQGRMLTDLYVFESGDMILLDVPAGELAGTMQRLGQFLFSEDVQFTDLSEALDAVWIHGPAGPSMLEQILKGASSGEAQVEPGSLHAWPEHHNARVLFAGTPIVVARVSQLGVPGFCVYVEAGWAAELERALVLVGAVAADPTVIEAARVHAVVENDHLRSVLVDEFLVAPEPLFQKPCALRRGFPFEDFAGLGLFERRLWWAVKIGVTGIVEISF